MTNVTRQEYPSVRSSQIDLLRLLAMLMVVCWHFYVHGIRRELSGDGVMLGVEPTLVEQLNGRLLQLVSVLCSMAVNVYVMLTGYLLLLKRFSVRRILRVWVQAVVTSLLIVLVYQLFSPTESLWQRLMLVADVRAYGGYWFVKCYVRMMLLSPLLLWLARSLRQTAFVLLLIVLFALGCQWTEESAGVFALPMRSGYSLMWFVVLFLTGAYLRRFPLPRRLSGWLMFAVVLAGAYAVQLAVSWPVVNFESMPYNGTAYPLAMLFLSAFVGGRAVGERLALCLSRLAPLAFGVYLVHDHELVRQWLWYDCSLWRSSLTLWTFPFVMLLVCMGIFAVCLALDFLRKKAFEKCRIDRAVGRISEVADRWIFAIVDSFRRN